MRLPGAQTVSTRALLTAQENIRSALEARAMICIYGAAGHGKSFAVNACLRELAPTLTRRIQFRARPSTRDLRPATRTVPRPGPARPPTSSSDRVRPHAPRRSAGTAGAGVRRGAVAVEAVVWGAGLFVRRQLPFVSRFVDDFGGTRVVQAPP
ncbi:hypothetical protein GCM10010431_87590 [Streptomyces kunmingensis]